MPDRMSHTPRRWPSARPGRSWIKPIALLGVSIAAAWVLIGFVGAIQWSEVAASFAKLDAGNVLVMLLVFFARQALNAIPLSRFVSGLSWRRSVQNDLGANVVGTFAPPPADVVLRVSMFNSWGISPVDGMAGVTMNTVTFYAVRFLAPVLGASLLALQEVDGSHLVTVTLSALVALAVIGALIAVMRGDSMASWLGRRAARVASLVKEGVDEDRWALAVVDFRGRMNANLRAGLAPSLLALVAMVLTDAVILLLGLRFIGVDATQLSSAEIVGGFLLAYPLTLMPLAGLGLLDAVLLAGYTEITGTMWEAEIVAALIVWRAITLGGPFVLGAITIAWWRRGVSQRPSGIA